MRKAVAVTILALVPLAVLAAPAQAAVKLVGCNDPEAVINMQSPWACDFPDDAR